MVVARLPAPDKLMKRSGAREDSSDDDGNVGEESAVDELAKAFGVKLDDEQRADAVEALRDFVQICMSRRYDEESDEDTEE
jgi:hypothetical protein